MIAGTAAQPPGVKVEHGWVAVFDPGPGLKQTAVSDMKLERWRVTQLQEVREPRLCRPTRGYQDELRQIHPRLPQNLAENWKRRERIS